MTRLRHHFCDQLVTLLTLEFSRPASLRIVTGVARIQCDVKSNKRLVTWLTNCSTVPSRGLPTWQGYQADFNGRWVADQTTRISSIVLSFHWGHEEPPGAARRAAIVWLEDWNERSTFALEFCGGFVAVGTFYPGIFDFVRQAVPPEVFHLVLYL